MTLPRQRRLPLRYTDSGEAHVHETPEVRLTRHFSSAFYQVVDPAMNQLTMRLDRVSFGMRTYLSLEQILTTGEMQADSDLCWLYSKLLKSNSLHIQLAMFWSKFLVKSLQDAHKAFQEMVPEVRSLFVDVGQLI